MLISEENVVNEFKVPLGAFIESFWTKSWMKELTDSMSPTIAFLV